jgi:hypothetical protein
VNADGGDVAPDQFGELAGRSLVRRRRAAKSSGKQSGCPSTDKDATPGSVSRPSRPCTAKPLLLSSTLRRFENSRNVEMRTVRLPKDLAGLGKGLLVLDGDFGVGVCFWNRERLLLK